MITRFAARFLVAVLLAALVGTIPGMGIIPGMGLAPGLQSVQASQGAALVAQPAGDPAPAVTLKKPRTIHAPYLPSGHVSGERFGEMAIFWMGRVTSSENYADVRVGYNDQALFIHASVFDRLVWYDVKPDPARLTNFDAVTVLLNTGDLKAGSLAGQQYRFVSAMNWWEDHSLYQAGYTGASKKWAAAPDLLFESSAGYAGGQFNNGGENRGWAMSFAIPFASLGLTEKPADGATWGLSVIVHDRDKKPPASTSTKTWPEKASSSKPSTWGRLVFGTPAYSPAPSTGGGTTVVRHKLDGQKVVDAGVGGNIGHLCDASAIWSKWGSYRFGGQTDVIIQNQSNLHDWPCFAKYYVTFPLSKVPRGKVIKSATLVMHLFGGSDWTQAKPSLIQVSTVNKDWKESTLTWNNAPLALENVAQTWVNPVDHAIQPDEWPGWRYEWDVSAAVAEAYAARAPLRLALYEADSDYHSGKIFTTSDTADWNAEGRPTLIIEWGEKVK